MGQMARFIFTAATRVRCCHWTHASTSAAACKKPCAAPHFEIRFDTAFNDVIAHCAHVPRKEGGIWLTPPIVEGFQQLHQIGLAHSVACWQDDQLVGGIYGLALGGVFFGESMFSLQPYASQAALVALVNELRRQKFQLFDAQIATPHTRQFGLYEVKPTAYQRMLATALTQKIAWGSLQAPDAGLQSRPPNPTTGDWRPAPGD